VTEVLFYQLDRRPLESVLQDLLEKCVERGWRTVVHVASEERLAALDAHLWTFAEESFLPHGTANDGHVAGHPVYLTTGAENPNAAIVRVLADGAEIADYSPYQRVVVVFDGNDTDARDKARSWWTAARTAGHAATYWQQSGRGGWEKKG
jgi:DNA polymerase-3 subunit chi